MALADQNTLSAQDAFQVRVMMAVLNYCQGTVIAETTNDVQTVSVSGAPTAGSFTLANGPLTAAYAAPFNATAGVLQAGLQAALASGNAVFCAGGPLPATPVAVTWTGGLANSPQNAMTVSANNLTGGTAPNAAVAHTTTGVGAVKHADRLNLAGRILDAPDKYKSRFAQMVTTDATVMSDYTGGGNLQTSVTDAHIAAAVGTTFNSFLGV